MGNNVQFFPLPFSLNYLKLHFLRNKIENPLSHAQDDEKCISREVYVISFNTFFSLSRVLVSI